MTGKRPIAEMSQTTHRDILKQDQDLPRASTKLGTDSETNQSYHSSDLLNHKMTEMNWDGLKVQKVSKWLGTSAVSHQYTR